MKRKYAFVAAMLLFLAVASVVLTNSYVRYERGGTDDDFTVVTSFYPVYIAAKNIIGDSKGAARRPAVCMTTSLRRKICVCFPPRMCLS